MRFYLIYCVVGLIVSPLLQAQTTTKIPGVGYTPPANALVYNCDTSTDNLTTRCGGKITHLNSSVSWSGSNGDVTGYVGRYLEGKITCAAAWICGVGNENECLNSSQVLRDMFLRGELGDKEKYTGEPTREECHDYGAQHPELGSIGGGGSNLRKQPTDPPGCCKKTLPCQVDEAGRLVGEVWQEAVLTPQGGRKGCFLVNTRKGDGGGSGGGSDNGGGSGSGSDGNGNGIPSDLTPKCWLIKFLPATEQTELKPITCPGEKTRQ